MQTPEDIFKSARISLEAGLEEIEKLLDQRLKVDVQKISHLAHIATDLGDKKLIGRAYLLLSIHSSIFHTDPLQALEYAKLALEFVDGANDPYWKLLSLHRLATCYHNIRNYSKELNTLYEAIHLLDKCPDDPMFYKPGYLINIALGIAYSQLGLYSICLPYVNKALSYATRQNNRTLIFKSKLTLGNLELYAKKYDEALEHYLELMSEYSDMVNTEEWAIMNNYIGIIYQEKYQLDKAESYIRESVRIRTKIGDELRLNYSLFSLAKILYLTDQHTEADMHFNTVVSVMGKYPHAYNTQVSNDILYELYAAKGDYKKSYEHFRHLDINFVNNETLQQTIGNLFENERLKQKQIQDEKQFYKDLNDDMQKQYNDLQKTNTNLNNYARTTSHDLREPLRMVYTYMTILEKKLSDKLSEEEKTLMRFAVDGSRRMDEMITRILQSAKGAQITYKAVDLNQVVTQVKLNLSKLISEKNAEVVIQQLPTVMADDIQMLQVFQNLISNALKYNVSKIPAVTIEHTITDKGYIVSVVDNGVGIPKNKRNDVFEMFSRIENESGAEGTGIGLSTVKSIIEKMKGQIWIDENPEGGTIIKVAFPDPNKKPVN